MEMFGGMIEIQELRNAVEMFVDKIPNPGSAVGKDHMELGGLKLPHLQLTPEPRSETDIVFPPGDIEGFMDLSGIEGYGEFHVMPVQAMLDRIGQTGNHDPVDSQAVCLRWGLARGNLRDLALGLQTLQVLSVAIGDAFDFA